MARQRAALRSQGPILLRGLQVLTRCALAQLSLLHTELTEALASGHLVLRQVAIEACCCLAQLGLLCGLRTYLLAKVGQLARTCLPKLCPLRFQRTHL